MVWKQRAFHDGTDQEFRVLQTDDQFRDTVRFVFLLCSCYCVLLVECPCNTTVPCSPMKLSIVPVVLSLVLMMGGGGSAIEVSICLHSILPIHHPE